MTAPLLVALKLTYPLFNVKVIFTFQFTGRFSGDVHSNGLGIVNTPFKVAASRTKTRAINKDAPPQSKIGTTEFSTSLTG